MQDILDDMIIEDSFNDYVRDSAIVNETSLSSKKEYEELKQQVAERAVKMKVQAGRRDFNDAENSKNYENVSKNEKKNNNVSYNNFLTNKLLNDKLFVKISELESELAAKKQKEKQLNTTYKQLEQQKEQLINEN